MKNIYFICLAIGLLCTWNSGLFAAEKTVEKGIVKGVVSVCGSNNAAGIQVFLPGKPNVVITGEDGAFQLINVTPGQHSLQFMYKGQVLLQKKELALQRGYVGNIELCDSEMMQQTTGINCQREPDNPSCVDADSDGYVAALDCDDNNSAVNPGAAEQCDGIDNNCDGKVDNGLFLIRNGEGKCEGGKITLRRCNKNFADCDEDPANGCEADLMNDNNNCGSCGNACAPSEVCASGIC
jgi:hypothetical protein